MMLWLVLALILAAPCFGQTVQSYRRAGTEFARQKSWDEAIADYRKALELEPNDPLTHYNLALALKYKGEASGAATEFQTALRLKPKWAVDHYGLGATW
jgi:Tfp pilus assembly protein PilF